MKLDPATMATVTRMFLDVQLEAYYVHHDATPERMATINCLVAQLNYWQNRS